MVYKYKKFAQRKLVKNILVCFTAVAALMLILWGLVSSGIVIFDHSAVVTFEGVNWNGKTYYPTSGRYDFGKRIAKSENGWNIYEVKGDSERRFIIASSFIDSKLYVSEDYDVPGSGEVTKAEWGGRYVRDKEFKRAVTEILSKKTTTFKYRTEAIFVHNYTQHMDELWVAYGDCPIATVQRGYLGKINGKWMITTYISPDQRNEDGSWKVHDVECYEIPAEYHEILERYLAK